MKPQPYMVMDGAREIGVVYETTAEDAAVMLDEDGDGFTARPATGEEVAAFKRESRLEARRERYAQKAEAGLIKSRAKPDQPALSMGTMMRAVDNEGRLRCARGHYTTADQIVNSPTGAQIGGAMVDFVPLCARCRAKAEA